MCVCVGGGGVKPFLKKKQRADIVGFLVCFFGHQSTPLSAIRPLPARFALFFPYLPTLTSNYQEFTVFILVAGRPVYFKRDLRPKNAVLSFSQKIQPFLKKLLNNKAFSTPFDNKSYVIFWRKAPLFPKNKNKKILKTTLLWTNKSIWAQRKTVILVCKFLFRIRILFAPPTLLLVHRSVIFKIS